MWKWGCEQYHKKEIGNQESTKKKEKNEKKRKFKGKGTRQCFAEYGGTHL